MTDASDRRVVVLKGGRSAEREVSLNTGAQVADALRDTGHDVVEIDAADQDFIGQLQTAGPDAVFICLHGRFGEDGTVQGLLDLLDIPYVGSGVLASALAMDKVMSKRVFESAGVPSPPFAVVRAGARPDIEALTGLLGDKTVVKPVNEGSAIGVTIAHAREELPAAIATALEHDTEALVERFVSGVEVTVGVIGNEEPIALPVLEIVPEHEFYDYESKYVPGMSAHLVPARISAEEERRCRELGIAAHQALRCRGLSRTDMIVAEDDIYVLEVNTIPGMTKTSLLPDAAQAAGIEFPELCRRLVDYALE